MSVISGHVPFGVGSRQVICVKPSLPGVKVPAFVVPAEPDRAVNSKPYDFIVVSVISTEIGMAGPPGVYEVAPEGREILTLPPPVFGVPVWQPDSMQPVWLSPGAPVTPAGGPNS